MSDKYLQEKLRLRDYLQIKGITYNQKRKTWRCFFHDDNDPSATLYENPDGHQLYCPVCTKSWNIFGICSKVEGIPDTKEDFPKLLESVRKTLNIPILESAPEPKTKKKKEKYPLPFPEDKREAFNKKISDIAKEKEWGEIKGSWKYFDKDGKTIALDVRYESQGERKNIITWWYDGKLKWYDAPIFIYGLNRLQNNKKILIHEGAKCADIGEKELSEFSNLSWSGGSGKSHLVDWSILKDYDIYILPDNDEPGMKAALNIKKQLSDIKIINTKSLNLQKGDDIEQILQILSLEKITDYILNPENHLNDLEVDTESVPSAANSQDQPLSPAETVSTSEPFKILGIGDDKRAYFLTESGRLYNWQLESLSKQKLMVLASNSYWATEYPTKKGADWDQAIDEVIRISEEKDFDSASVRGRGAWIDGEKISYHDGRKTYGEYDKRITYIRLKQNNPGINEKPAEIEICHKIRDIIFEISFETKTDAVRCMGWAVIAPFAGALKYRPAILLTGPSGSGKSTVQEYILSNLTQFIWADAKETSNAGIRSRIGLDSAVVFFDEAEKDNDKAKLRIEDMLSFIRSNFTSHSPDAYKGTKEGGWISYKMNSIFGIAAVNPTIENVADENRIFRINMVKSQNNGWKQIEKELKDILTNENCKSIRALTWQKLKIIFDLTDRIVDFIQGKTGKDYRTSYSDALLASAFIIIWDRIDNPDDESINKMLDKYYTFAPPEEKRDEASEFIEELLDTIIEIQQETSNQREKKTILECLINCYELEEIDGKPYRMQLSRIGIKITDENNLAIANNSSFIIKTMRTSKGYSKILKRHPRFCEKDKTEYFPHDRISRKCTILKDILENKKKDWKDMDMQEQLTELMG